MKFDVPLPLWGGVEDTGFRLPVIKAMFSSIDWFIVVLVVVAELESNI